MGALAVQHRADGTAVITLSGRLDAESSEAVESHLDYILTAEPTLVVFDLGDVEYISSAGVRLILKARNWMNKRDRKVLAAAPNAQARRVFSAIGNLAFDALIEDLSGLDRYLPGSDQPN